MSERNLLVVQGGGPTQVLNATLAAIISEAHGQFAGIFGARWGVKGAARGEIVDLGRLSEKETELLRMTPGAALGSSRARPTEDELTGLIEQLRRLRIRDLLFLGGNGTMRGAETVHQFCRDAGFEVQVIGVPKTVDNDLVGTDRCPGYASAARFIAQSTRDLGVDVRSLPQPVSILETMGRSVGWLAAAAAAGKETDQDAPHLVYLPERPFEMSEFFADLDAIVARQGWAIVVVAEGIRNCNGACVYQEADPVQADPLKRPFSGGVAHFLAGQVAQNLKMRCRSEQPGLLGRSSMLHVSAQDRRDAILVGQAGVRALLAGESQNMVSLTPLNPRNDSEYKLVPLENVANVERPIPVEWTCGGSVPVSETFFNYLKPLIGELVRYAAPLPNEWNVRGEG